MANYATLKAAIAAAIKQNGNNEITGNLLQQQLLAMVNSLGVGYQFVGVATPQTNPGTPDQNIFYIAVQQGIYANFNSESVYPGTIVVFKWNGAWIKEEIRPVYVDNARMQKVIQELYISGYVSSLRLSILTWTGTSLSLRIIDGSGNIVAAIVNRPTQPYEPVYFETYQTSPIPVRGYIVLNENIETLTSPSGYQIFGTVSNIFLKPFITEKLISEYKDAIAAVKTQIENEESTICVNRFNRGTLNPNGLYNNSYIAISRRFSITHDSIFVFGNKDAAGCTNKFWDFRGVYVHERTNDNLIYSPANVTQFGDSIVAATATDNILPVIVGAVNNIDGDNTEKWFTGQNHAYGNTGAGPTPTMRELSCNVNVDGIAVPIGGVNYRGKICTIEVVNLVQGYNTCKQDGSGRAIIKQKITATITKDKCSVRVEYLALEDVIFYSILGIAQYAAANSATQYRLIGSKSKPGLYDYNGTAVTPNNDDNKINCLEFIRGGRSVSAIVKNVGIGNLNYNTTQSNAYSTTANKVYTRLTDSAAEIALETNDKLCFEVEYGINDNAI